MINIYCLGKEAMETFERAKYKLIAFGVIIIIILLQIFKIRFGMDFIIITLCIFAIVQREGKQFIIDWGPPIVLFYLYEGLRAYAFDVSKLLGIHPIVQPIITLERKTFFFLDQVPSVKLQRWLRPNLAVAHWYDYVLFFFYIMFFWYWLVIGYILWKKARKTLFKPYMYGLVAFSLIDVVFYALFPSAPPWYAADHGYFPWISRILWTIKYLPSGSFSAVSTYGRNDFAAFPSHHTAWPFYATLFMIKLYGKKALPLLIIPFMIAFATWYGAEHYVVDSISAVFVCLITFFIAINFSKIKVKLFKFLHRK